MNSKVIFRFLSGTRAIKFDELVDESTGQLAIAKQKIDSRLYFMLGITIDGVIRKGVWSVGRSLRESGFTISHERLPDNNTAISTSTIALKNFFLVSDFCFQSFLDSSEDFDMTKTAETVAFGSKISSYEKFFATNGSSIPKKLVGVTVETEALPSNGNILLSYKKDEENSFTTIFSDGTDNSISHSAVNIESSGAKLPEYKEITLRIESTGGAEITGLNFQEELINKKLY